MDVGGSFLELACVRIAVIPAGPPIPDYRFDELSTHLTSFREVAVNALPRRTPLSRPTASASFHSTFSSFTSVKRESLTDNAKQLTRSQSSVRDTPHLSRPPAYPSFSSSRNVIDLRPYIRSITPQSVGRSDSAFHDSSPRMSTATPSPRFHSEPNLSGPDVDSSFRMRYEVIYRDHAGTLLMRPTSEWDEFHSTKVWGVFGIVDCTGTVDEKDTDSREQVVAEAIDDFRAALAYFKQSAVRRLIVFIHPDAQHNGPFVLNDPSSVTDSPSGMSFSLGHIPERTKPEETRLEARAQVIHFAGLLLNEINVECWRRRDSPTSELFLSPIDENVTTDRQSKLAKRRAGRLDKLLGDSLLLMGSPAEALLKYSSAMERSKASSDRLWLAGAMEGWSAAHVLAHVGNGGSANDKSLTDKLIEHYAEIYKLYQKKRVAEPEAAAAMRLAEFLSRWTSRRKEALDAAQHAAMVGENLRTTKRAVLWEALARFSDRMGCRRTAALYLFRLGQLDASQGVLSSAVTLMIAAERQLCRGAWKPWASLNRRVLLTAAHYAEEAGDLNTAAKLYVEALVAVPSGVNGIGDTDQGILKSLTKVQVPAHVSAASKILALDEASPCEIQGLSIRRRENSKSESEKPNFTSREGPFIYNPFEARKRAKEAANAKRTVTWICNEPAMVHVRILSHIRAELNAEIIAVLFSDSKSSEVDVTPKSQLTDERQESDKQPIASELLNGTFVGDEEHQSANHAQYVRHVLERSTELAHTVRESFTVHPYDRYGSMKYITVIPQRTGPLFIEGLLLRLLNGALVILRDVNTKANMEADPPVNVMQSLPRLKLSVCCADGGYDEDMGSRNNIVVYDGERQSLSFKIQNCGTEKITWMKMRVSCADEGALDIISDNITERDMLDNLENPGDSHSYQVVILGRWNSNQQTIGAERKLEKVTNVSFYVEYESSSSSGVIRESTTHVRITCRCAVGVGRLIIFEGRESERSTSNSLSPIRQYLAVEVRNYVSVPARIVVIERNSVEDESIDTLCSDENLVEHQASARLVCIMGEDLVRELRKAACNTCRKEINTGSHTHSILLMIRWTLSSMGREGFLTIDAHRLWKAAMQTWSPQTTIMQQPVERKTGVHADMLISLRDPGPSREGYDLSRNNIVWIGRFTPVRVDITNLCETPFPTTCSLDIEVVQQDDKTVLRQLHRVCLVGITQRVLVGAIPGGGGKFSHELKVRVASTGSFDILAFLYDAARSTSRTDSIGKARNGRLKHYHTPSSNRDSLTSHFPPVVGDNLKKPVLDVDKQEASMENMSVIDPQSVDSTEFLRSQRKPDALLACSVLRIFGVRDGARFAEN